MCLLACLFKKYQLFNILEQLSTIEAYGLKKYSGVQKSQKQLYNS